MARVNSSACRITRTCSAGPTPSQSARPCSAAAWSTAPGASPRASCMSAMRRAISRPEPRTRSAMDRPGPARDGSASDRGSDRVLAPAGVTPALVPVRAVGIDDAAVGFEELVGYLEDREHQPALRTPGNVPAMPLAPDVFAGFRLDALCRTFPIDQAAFQHIGLLDADMLVVGQHRARREPHQRGHQARRMVEQ